MAYAQPQVRKRPGKFYLTQVKGTYSCCQLLTAFNAWSFLHWRPSPIKPGTKLFERFVDLVCCRIGAAIGVYKAWRYLGLQTQKGP